LLRVRDGAWLLLLDEPTAHLDQASARLVLDAVQRAVDNGAAAVIAAHERTAAVDMSTSLPDSLSLSTVDAASPPLPWRALLDGRLFGGAALGAVALLAGVALTATSGWLIAKASQQPPILTLTVAVVGVRAFGLSRAGLRYVERLVTHDAAFRIAGRLRERLWNSLVRLGPARSLRAGEGQRRLVADVDTVRDLLPRVVTPPLVIALVAAGAIAVQAWVLPAAGWTLVAAVALGLCAPLVALRAERRATSALATGRRDVAARALVLFEAAAELLAFGRAAEHRRALAEADTRLVTQARRQAYGAGAAEALVTLACGAAAVVSTAFAAQAVTAGRLDPVLAPLLALVPLALAEVLAMLPPVAQHWDTLKQARRRLAEAPPDESAGAAQAESTTTASRPADVEARVEVAVAGSGRSGERRAAATRSRVELAGPSADLATLAESPRVALGAAERPSVELRGADLGWPDGPVVLRGVDVTLAPGTYAAVVGPSGAGKSTLVAALLGFLAPRQGVVSVPGDVAWAPQEPMLAATTVGENLRLARPAATEEQLREALHQAVLDDVEAGTMLGSGGSGLSGGQAQRVALARALLGAPSAGLVLLDEPTAHLDEPTACAVRARLREALAGRTVVHVTHRADEAEHADVVLEVRDGRVLTRVPVAGAT
jgi:ATP-binding cassette subfamily C protein CydD/ATP-binding cassette subfamily C protein CydCD